MRTAISAYLNGYNIFILERRDKKCYLQNFETTSKTLPETTWLELKLSLTHPTELTLQVLLNYPELTVQNALSRMSIIASSMHKEAIEALKKLDYSKL